MHQFRVRSSSLQDRRRRSRLLKISLFGFLLFVLIVASAVIWRSLHSGIFTPRPDVGRFDCHPDRPISEDSCKERGCLYHLASDQDVSDQDLIESRFIGVPSCYFPEGYAGYGVHGKQVLKNGEIQALLKRLRPSGFKDDVKWAKLIITPVDDQRLRIQVKDAYTVRHEVQDVVHYTIKKEKNRLYHADLSNGIISVTRKSTEAIVFQADLSQLVFSDQFMQISINISSHYIYGLGEQKEGILKSTNWTRYTVFNQGDLPVPNRNLYGSHPFFMVMEPNGDSNGVFLLNSHAIDYILQPTPAVTIRAIGGIFDFYILLGPTPDSVVSQLTSLFDWPNFPPRWSLGFHLCKYGYFSLNKTKKTLYRNIDAGVPVDVQWHDIDYMDRYLDFTYDGENFEGLPEFVNELHNGGRHYVAMISPGVSNSENPGTYPAYDEGKKLDLFVKDMNGSKYIEGKVWNKNLTVFPDFSHPNTTDYWKEQFSIFHSKLNFDGVWIDMNEPLNFLNGSNYGCPESKYDSPPYVPGRPYPLKTLTLCMSAKHHRSHHYSEHNLIAYREAKATHAVMQEMTGKRPFIISRATFSGQGVYSGHWSGDITSNWDDLRYTIPAMLTFSLYGMAMTGSDICGFRLNTTEELCARWHSLGAFYPFARNHNDYDTKQQDPAYMGATVLQAAKKALSIRYYFLPYLYTLFYRNHFYGETVARPLFFEFPRDNNTYDIDDEFLWGPAFLILPVLDKNVTTITPYIPKGRWYGMDGTIIDSKGESVELQAEITDINILVRGGFILPAQKPENTTTQSAKNPFDLYVALDEDEESQGELFWDDGETIDTIKNEKYNLIKFSAEECLLKVMPKMKGYDTPMALGKIEIHGLSKSIKNVTINNETVEYDIKGEVERWLEVKGAGYFLLDELFVRWTFNTTLATEDV